MVPFRKHQNSLHWPPETQAWIYGTAQMRLDTNEIFMQAIKLNPLSQVNLLENSLSICFVSSNGILLEDFIE